jgi:hypothetical protein
LTAPELRAQLSEVVFELASISRQGPKVRKQLARTVRELEARRAEIRAQLRAL